MSRRAAQALGVLYVDSGSLYRAVTWLTLQQDVDPADADAVAAMMDGCSIRSVLDQGVVRFQLDGVDPGPDLRSDPVVERVSTVAAIPEVRRRIVDLLRRTARWGDLVMEGRDIGTVVFPDTPFKFFLDADPAERARRRHLEQVTGGPAGDLEQVMSSLRRRDQQDASRSAAPLTVAEGAEVINTTTLAIEDVVARIVNRVRAGRRIPG